MGSTVGLASDARAAWLEDDVLVKGEKGVLWVARWSDAESARAFAKRHASWVGEERVEVKGATSRPRRALCPKPTRGSPT